MLRVFGILVIIALYISFVVDVVRTPGTDARSLPKALWLVIVLILPILGGVLWYFFGRMRPAPGSRWGRRRPTAPDDDPRFLKQLEDEAWRKRMQQRRGEV